MKRLTPPSSDWRFVAAYGLTTTDDHDAVKDPLFADATLVSPSTLARMGVLTGKIGSPRPLSTLPKMKHRERLVELTPDCYVGVRRSSLDSAKMRAREVLAALSLAYSFTGRPIITKVFSTDPSAIAVQYLRSARIKENGQPEYQMSFDGNDGVPLEGVPIDLGAARSSLRNATAIQSGDRRWMLAAEDPWTLLLGRQAKRSSLQKILRRNFLLLHEVLEQRSPRLTALLSITALERMFVDTSDFRLLERRFGVLGKSSEGFLKGLFDNRHHFVHDGSAPDPAEAMAAWTVAVITTAKVAYLAEHISSKEQLLAYLDFWKAASFLQDRWPHDRVSTLLSSDISPDQLARTFLGRSSDDAPDYSRSPTEKEEATAARFAMQKSRSKPSRRRRRRPKPPHS
ncbi:MAG: hypothetical protein ACE37F_25175 [Nannocystaceae bacterium]|nr:hypothetical protein [bacterium]